MEEKNLFDPTPSLFQMNLDAQNSYNLRSAASWARVMGVTGILLGVFFAVMTVLAFIRLNEYSSRYGYRRRGSMDTLFGNGFTGTSFGLWIMIITSVIFILGGIFSLHFGNRINLSLKTNNQLGLNNAFAALRNYYALRSITLIIVLTIIFLGLAGSV